MAPRSRRRRRRYCSCPTTAASSRLATDAAAFENRLGIRGASPSSSSGARSAANHERRFDARTRQETAARPASDHNLPANKDTNDNALRQAKQRLAKIERVGLGRDDGKRYKTNP